MTHAFVFSTRPGGAHGLWTWRCSCGERQRSVLFGAAMTWVPLFDAMKAIETHLVAVDAEIVPELLDT